VMRGLEKRRLIDGTRATLSTSQPLTYAGIEQAELIMNDPNEATWEEMEFSLASESNMGFNGLMSMATAGAIATVGIATDTIHVVVGAMVIAPGFEPLSRIGLGVVAGGSAARRGVRDTAKGYAALLVAAMLTAWVLAVIGSSPFGDDATYLADGALSSYWTSITATAVLVSCVASIAGAILIAGERQVLTAGVMIALALVPSTALAGAGLALGEFRTAGLALGRLLVDIGAVTALSTAVFAAKRARTHRRRSLHATPTNG